MGISEKRIAKKRLAFLWIFLLLRSAVYFLLFLSIELCHFSLISFFIISQNAPSTRHKLWEEQKKSMARMGVILIGEITNKISLVDTQ